ncbi:hypothetical protein JIG36_33525 [Actinoplanes sp. LDG1-06]|uniref:Immunity protein Imm1 n=1 Tax=Paractinoplanes ovalisporus TaxID=2810368 RepID=A0ABS2AKS0_9ACTN|nr:hypothetical protein [Actinoplanes ovalisporus]MBM2620442.1 hypothetical protein [Actinoplanes ovalisporus]
MKQFRRDAGPGQSAYGLEVLAAEVARLAALIGVTQPDVLTFEPNNDGRPWLLVDADGVYHWVVADEDRPTTARDDVLYWSFAAAVAATTPNGADQIDLLRGLDPRWAERRARELSGEDSS